MFHLPSEDKRKDFVGVVAEQKKDVQLLGKVRKPKGMKLFEYNPATDQVREVAYKQSVARLNDFTDKDTRNIEIHHKVIAQSGCVYVLAINEKNAKKKALK